MKQHITFEQLNELSEKGKEVLKKWWETHLEYGTFFAWKNNKRQKNWYVDLWHDDSDIEMPNKYNNFYPLLSIGQMIEFLDEQYEDWIIEYRDDLCFFSDDNRLVHGMSGELCDALFEAVKEVLEQ